MRRIGILGGTFNPIHIGHLRMAQVAEENLRLDKVLFIPSYLPPHKSGRNILSADDRYEMARLAAQGNSHFEVSNFEINKRGKSYSIDTVRYLQSQYPKDTKLFFIIGYDSFLTLSKWKKINELLNLVTFVVINRPGAKAVKPKIKAFSLLMPGLDVSSSYIRSQIAKGKTGRYLVPERVWEYIEKNRLYYSSYWNFKNKRKD